MIQTTLSLIYVYLPLNDYFQVVLVQESFSVIITNVEDKLEHLIPGWTNNPACFAVGQQIRATIQTTVVGFSKTQETERYWSTKKAKGSSKILPNGGV